MIEWQSKEDELTIALPAPTMSDGEEGALEVEADLVFLEPPLSPLPGGLLVGAGLTDGIVEADLVFLEPPLSPLPGGLLVGAGLTDGIVEADLVFLEPPLPGGLLVGAGLTDGIADGGSVIASGPILVGTVGLLGSIVGDLEGSKETDGA